MERRWSPVTGVSELVLEVSSVERAERFYVEKLGLPVVERWPHRNAVWVLAGSGTRLGLWEPQVGLLGSRGGEHVHFAMHVDEADFDRLLSDLRGRDLDVQVREFSGLGEADVRTRSAYVNDPDGHLVEFWTARMSSYGAP